MYIQAPIIYLEGEETEQGEGEGGKSTYGREHPSASTKSGGGKGEEGGLYPNTLQERRNVQKINQGLNYKTSYVTTIKAN